MKASLSRLIVAITRGIPVEFIGTVYDMFFATTMCAIRTLIFLLPKAIIPSIVSLTSLDEQ